MTSTTWRTDMPPAPGWRVTDGDPDLLRHFDGREWSAPVHRDDFDRLAPRVRGMPAEARDAAIEWRE